MSHTPGPWRIEVIHVTEGAYTISHGTNRHGDGPEGEVGKFYGSKEDARLMASAPELLDALEMLVDDAHPMLYQHRKAVARAAIAKATGKD